MTRRRAARRGFTLVELTVVLFIIALGTALAVPMVESGLNSREVRRAARQIAATMHYCRGEAIATGSPQMLLIDPAQNRIETGDQGRWAVLTDRAQITGVVGGTSVGDGSTQLLFYPNGSTSGGEVSLSARYNSQYRLKVTLHRLIGNVRVDEDTE